MMDDTTKAAIKHLKDKGFIIYETVPDLDTLSLDELKRWRVKLNAWNTDSQHMTLTQLTGIRDEIEKRTEGKEL
jgi:hypothetical protein